MNNPITSISSVFFQELLQYKIPHSSMIPNIPKYNGMTYPDEHIDTYEWTITSLRMDKRFTGTYFSIMLSGNASKWFKALCPGSISSFEQLRYIFLHNFMQLRKVKGDANSIMSCKEKEGESIRAYYDWFTHATLSVPVTGAFAQGLLPGLRKMQGTMPKSRDEIKYRIEGEEHKQANLKVVANAYLKQESTDSHYHYSHKERNDGSHDKHNKNMRHSSRRFHPFVKDEPRNHKLEVHVNKSKTNDTGECAILKREVEDNNLSGDFTEIAKNLRSKFEAEKKDGRTRKEANRQPIKKEEIVAIVRPKDKVRRRLPTNGVDSSPNDTLSISFSPEDL
uniref:Retrotransposon gag domain-containing protein n=1 Tax=Lactuca sativa TaxID=4236 RepID=A0A9R1UE73_LACSA|nr:hypothetical protein LSAT_V11C900463730 [Lactuca sativa]